MSEIKLAFQKQKIILAKERTVGTVGTFWSQAINIFLFRNRRTLKFLKMKYNPTNKRTMA